MPHISDPLLQAYIDGYCNGARIAEVETHIEACAECRDRLEDARDAARRASELLGALDPGPVHAPAFEELQARAADRAGDQEIEAPPGEEVDWASVLAAHKTPKRAPVSFWRRPALAWAATIVMAFGLGWLSRTELGLPADLQSPAGPSLEGFRAGSPSEAEADEAAVRLQERVGADKTDEGQASQRELVAADAIDDVQAAAKRSASLEVASELAPQPVSTAPTVQQARVQREAGAQIPGARATAGERQVAAEEVAAPPPVRENAPAESELRSMELNEQFGRAGTSADIGVGAGFFVVDREGAELWLGIAPRELPDLALLRVEVGPGVLFDNGLPGRPAVRLVYRARSGQEISLLQQYTGPLEDAEQAQIGALADNRPDAAAAPARAERSRSSGLGVESKITADRDAVAVGGTLDLPVTERLPDGTNVYRWSDGTGYLLSISGAIEPDILRALADVIR